MGLCELDKHRDSWEIREGRHNAKFITLQNKQRETDKGTHTKGHTSQDKCSNNTITHTKKDELKQIELLIFAFYGIYT